MEDKNIIVISRIGGSCFSIPKPPPCQGTTDILFVTPEEGGSPLNQFTIDVSPGGDTHIMTITPRNQSVYLWPTSLSFLGYVSKLGTQDEIIKYEDYPVYGVVDTLATLTGEIPIPITTDPKIEQVTTNFENATSTPSDLIFVYIPDSTEDIRKSIINNITYSAKFSGDAKVSYGKYTNTAKFTLHKNHSEITPIEEVIVKSKEANFETVYRGLGLIQQQG